MGKEKDKKPLFGGIFQKFFKPSAKAEAKKKKEHHLTVQRSIPYLEMGRDGICRVEEHLYSKTVRFYDINYQLAQNEDKNTIFESWCDFLNYFDSSIRFQLSFINHKSDMSEYNKVIQIEPQHDQFDDVRMEYAQMLKQQLAKGNNGLVRTKYITFSIEAKSVKEAKPRLERIETDILNNFKVLGVKAYPLNGVERLQIMYEMFHQEEERKFEFSYDRILQSGMTTKDFIAPTSFLFKSGKDFQMGDTIGAVSYLNILAPELTDKVLAEFLDMDKNLVVSIHVQSVDQLKAIKLIKGKITDLDRMKIEEQKKAVRSGYDMEIIPSDLATYGGEAKKILDDLQSRNERMFLITVLFLNAAKTKQDLDSAVFQTAGIAQKFNCTLNRLDYMQEQGLMSSLPLANNLVPIKRALTTTSTAIFVPFTTQELFMEGDSLYYGLNAVSNNMIMADRKQLKNPNGLILGTPGSGKSFSAKREMTNVFFTTTDDIIIADPEGEYYPLVEALGGQVIHISSTSRDYINPMDINLNYADDDNPLGMKSDFILSLCELIMGARDGMEPEEKSVIDRCLPLVYQKYLNDPKPENMPILGDLYDCLREQKERQAQRIATALEIYVNGSLRVFNHQTNVELDNRLICFDIKELGKQLKKLGMLIVQDQVWNRVTINRNAKRKNLLMGSNPIIAPDSEMLWNAAIVWRILRRYEYTGALVMGRRKKIDVNTTSVRTLPEDKWIIAENAHAAIVTRDEYYQAQKAIRNVTPIQYKVGDDFVLKGKICCGNCNRQLRHERQYGEMVFYCGYKRSAGKFSKCYGGYYREYSVNAKVARAIKTVFYALDVVNQGMQEKQSITVRCVDIEDLEKQAEAIRVEQIKLYESYADGVLLRDAYIEKKKVLSEKLAALQDSIRTEKEEQECADELDEEIRALTKQASEKTYIGGLTKECVDAFVSMVYLYDDQTMKIEFNCEDVIRRALEKYGA